MSKTLLFCMTLLCSLPAFSADLMLRIHNQTFLNLTALYISPANEDAWQDNLLTEGQVIKPNTYVSLNLKNATTPFVDVRAVDESDAYLYQYAVNARSDDVSFSVEDKVANKSRERMQNKSLEKLLNMPK